MPVLIEVKNLTVDFDGLKALKNVSLNVNEGEIVGVLGKSGSAVVARLMAIFIAAIAVGFIVKGITNAFP